MFIADALLKAGKYQVVVKDAVKVLWTLSCHVVAAQDVVRIALETKEERYRLKGSAADVFAELKRAAFPDTDWDQNELVMIVCDGVDIQIASADDVAHLSGCALVVNEDDRRSSWDFLIFPRPLRRRLAVEPSLRIKDSEITLSGVVLGRGASCEVVTGTYRETPVAVKVLFVHATKDNFLQVEREVAVLTSVRHPGIVLCFGAMLEEGKVPWVVLELMQGGSLAETIPRADFSLAQRTDCLSQVARALVFLHSRQPAVVHRDVKPTNILLEQRDGRRAKLADFGVSRCVETMAATMSGGVGTQSMLRPRCSTRLRERQWRQISPKWTCTRTA